MLFNSVSFAIFLPVVFALYWFIAKRKLIFQNILLLIASYFFYACWDYRFLFLLIFSTALDYFSGLKMQGAENKNKKRFWFWLSIIINLSFLGVFKYYNFFAESFSEAISQIGLHANPWTLKVILPVGISFYTFHGLSYVIDIYNKKINAEKNFITYSVFVSFFPLLVAGPIERATHLLPQIRKDRIFDYTKAVDGLRQILWGLFKKVVIADQCARYANLIFDNANDYSGTTLVLGAVLFAFQIYGDFSGYSDIALGTARLFGFDLLRNFAFPYFSRDIAEFWRRWHISLSSWFRDYLYIPLGGSRGETWMRVRNTLIIFLVSGFWHGANWTFIVWGLLNAIYMMPLIIFRSNRDNIEIVAKGKIVPTLKEARSMVSTFGLVVIAWIFFRAEDLSHAIRYIKDLFIGLLDISSYMQTIYFVKENINPAIYFSFIVFLFLEWIGREQQYAIANLGMNWKRPLRWAVYYAIIIAIFWLGGEQQQFIYFQF